MKINRWGGFCFSQILKALSAVLLGIIGIIAVCGWSNKKPATSDEYKTVLHEPAPPDKTIPMFGKSRHVVRPMYGVIPVKPPKSIREARPAYGVSTAYKDFIKSRYDMELRCE